MKTYTEQEVIQMLITERERNTNIVDAFYNKYKTKADTYLPMDKDLIYIAEQEAEVCRKIANTIDGRLLMNVNEPLEEQIKREYFK